MDIQLELPFTMDDCGGSDWVYLDQAPINRNYRVGGGYRFSAFYTPLGIKHLESEYIQKIKDLKPGDDYKSLRWEILSDPNLHGVIKRNLVYNLDKSVLVS